MKLEQIWTEIQLGNLVSLRDFVSFKTSIVYGMSRSHSRSNVGATDTLC
jgi:hypothetical protein